MNAENTLRDDMDILDVTHSLDIILVGRIAGPGCILLTFGHIELSKHTSNSLSSA